MSTNTVRPASPGSPAAIAPVAWRSRKTVPLIVSVVERTRRLSRASRRGRVVRLQREDCGLRERLRLDIARPWFGFLRRTPSHNQLRFNAERLNPNLEHEYPPARTECPSFA